MESDNFTLADFEDERRKIVPPGYRLEQVPDIRRNALLRWLSVVPIIPVSVAVYILNGVYLGDFFTHTAGAFVLTSIVFSSLWGVTAFRLLSGQLLDGWDRFVSLITFGIAYPLVVNYGGSSTAYTIQIVLGVGWIVGWVVGERFERRAFFVQDLSGLPSSEAERLARTFGLELLRLRENQNLTRDELAERAKISPSWLKRLEAGERRPTTIIIRRLARALSANGGAGYSLQIERTLRSQAGESLRYGARRRDHRPLPSPR